jgi:hypothetical protein
MVIWIEAKDAFDPVRPHKCKYCQEGGKSGQY